MSQPTSTSNNKQYLTIALLIVFLLTIWVATRFFNQPAPAVHQEHFQASDCDLRNQSCVVNFGELILTLDVEPKEIRSLTPLTYTVTVNGGEVQSLLLDIQGKEMFMGLNQTQLTPVPNSKGVFKGTGELGACVTGEMMWRATLVAETDQGQLKTWFDFPAQ